MEAFAHALDELRGDRTFESMSRHLARAGTPVAIATLSAAARGQRLPTWQTVEAFVRACGQDPSAWRDRWERTSAARTAPRPATAGASSSPPAGSAPGGPAATDPAGTPAPARALRNGVRRKVLIAAAGIGVAVAVPAAVLTVVGHRGAATAGGSVPTPPSPRLWTAMSGPTCSTGGAVAMDTSGSWTPLAGTAAGGCGNAFVHRTTDSGDGANWVFHPGVGKTCTFRIDIPDSSTVTAGNVTYQAWDTLPGQHSDTHRIGGNVRADQRAARGRAIAITFGPTRNGTIDLQIYDDYPDHTTEVAGTVTATCR